MGGWEGSGWLPCGDVVAYPLVLFRSLFILMRRLCQAEKLFLRIWQVLVDYAMCSFSLLGRFKIDRMSGRKYRHVCHANEKYCAMPTEREIARRPPRLFPTLLARSIHTCLGASSPHSSPGSLLLLLGPLSHRIIHESLPACLLSGSISFHCERHKEEGR